MFLISMLAAVWLVAEIALGQLEPALQTQCIRTRSRLDFLNSFNAHTTLYAPHDAGVTSSAFSSFLLLLLTERSRAVENHPYLIAPWTYIHINGRISLYVFHG